MGLHGKGIWGYSKANQEGSHWRKCKRCGRKFYYENYNKKDLICKNCDRELGFKMTKILNDIEEKKLSKEKIEKLKKAFNFIDNYYFS